MPSGIQVGALPAAGIYQQQREYDPAACCESWMETAGHCKRNHGAGLTNPENIDSDEPVRFAGKVGNAEASKLPLELIPIPRSEAEPLRSGSPPQQRLGGNRPAQGEHLVGKPACVSPQPVPPTGRAAATATARTARETMGRMMAASAAAQASTAASHALVAAAHVGTLRLPEPTRRAGSPRDAQRLQPLGQRRRHPRPRRPSEDGRCSAAHATPARPRTRRRLLGAAGPRRSADRPCRRLRRGAGESAERALRPEDILEAMLWGPEPGLSRA